MNLNKILFSLVLCLLNVLPTARAATGSICSSNSPFDITEIQQDTLFIEVPNDNALVTDLNVRLAANTVSGLSVRLSHGGASSVFFNQPTNGTTHCGSQSFNITLDDEATTTLDSCVNDAALSLNGSYKPSNALSVFKDIPVSGNWTLEVIAGTQTPGLSPPEITQWCLDYTYELPAPQYEAFENEQPFDGTLNFGEIKVKQDSAPIKSFTIRNTGTANLTISYAGLEAISGNSAAFDIINPSTFKTTPITIPPGSTQVIGVEFSPIEIGQFETQLVLTSNDTNQAEIIYTLEGAAKIAPQYQSTPPPGELGELKALIGQTATRQVTISNVAVDSVLLNIEVIGFTGNTDNTVSVSGLPAGASIVAGGSLTFTLQCTPKASSSRFVTLNLKSNAENQPEPTYAIKCTGITTPPGFASTPSAGTPIDFGNIFIGQPEYKTITITETSGNSTLYINNATISGDHRSDFAVSPTNLSINGGQSSSLEISCNPLAFGPRRATLNLPTNVPTSINDNTPKTFQYPLSCAGVGADYKASLPPDNTIAFHTTGSQPVSQSFEIWNEGNELLVVTFNGIYGEHPDDFALQAPPEFINGGDPVITIPAGSARKVVTLMCDPQAVGERKAILSLISNDPGEPKYIEYPLLCKNNASNSRYKSNPSSAATLAFGNSLVGESVTTSFKIQELGNDDLKVDFIGFEGEHASDFTLVKPDLFPLTIVNDSGAEPEVQIQCMPSDTGQRTAVLKLKSNDVDKPNPIYKLRCHGILEGSIYTSTPAPHSVLNFGYVRVTQSNSQLLTIRNKGNRPLKITNISIKGEHAHDFSLSTQKDVSLANTETEFALTITCEPQQKGLRTATLNLKSNDSANETIEYPLTCVGTANTIAYPGYASNPPPRHDIKLGHALIGTPTHRQLVISQTGTAPLKVELIGFEGQHAADFSLSTDFPLHLSETAEPIFVTIQCTPSAVGIRSAILKLKTNDHLMLVPSYPVSCQGDLPAGYHSEPAPASTLDFGELSVGLVKTQNLIINETGDWDLNVDLFSLEGPHAQDFAVLTPQFPFTVVDGSSEQTMRIRCKPSAAGLRQATLKLKTNDPQLLTPNYQLNCQGKGNCYQFNFYPQDLDFGSELVGASSQMEQRLFVYTRGCSLPQLETIVLTGTHADEFSIVNQDCYNRYQSFSCQYTVVFSPTQAGVKQADLEFIFDNSESTSVALSAQAIEQGEAELAVSPMMLDFGSVTLDDFSDQTYQKLVLQNQGNVNLRLSHIELAGLNPNDFYIYASQCRDHLLKPTEYCELKVQFTPDLSFSSAKDAELMLSTKQQLMAQVKLHGQVVESSYCQDNNITLESSGLATDWADSNAWYPHRLPTPTDVIRINQDHTIVAQPFAQLAVLCIEAGAQLISADQQGTPLEIQAYDFIENKGSIRGLAGTDAKAYCFDTEASGNLCAQAGASVILKVGRNISHYDKREDWWWYSYDSGGPVLNLGQIVAGNGGQGYDYGAPGGNAIVLGRNTINQGQILGGHGGDILTEGTAGPGGLTQIWGKLGGQGHLYNRSGAQAFAGDGGNCNPDAEGPQSGGEGGNLWLVSLPNVHLEGGLHRAGKGGNKCTLNGEEGNVTIEPSLISLAGAQTHIDGNNVTIFGGNDWQLTLTDLNTIVIEAQGDITLAVGDGGIIDFRGNQQPILKAQGQVNIFADTLLLDEGITLEDLIEAEAIEVGPQRILRAVSLTGAGKIIGAPGETISVQLILANNSPQTDQFTLESPELTEPLTIEVPGLSTLEWGFPFTLPEIENKLLALTVTATSQADPSVYATHSFQLASSGFAPPTDGEQVHYNANIDLIEDSVESDPLFKPGSIPIVEHCPTTGFINWVCRNDDQIMSDAYLGRRAAIAGGMLNGHIENHGLVSQVTLKTDAVLIGGKLSGYILNQGWLESFEFVGAALNGGTLAGDIVNNSRIGGVLRNVNLAAHTHVRGGYLAGTIQGNAQAPALLEQLTIKAGSTVSHVIIGSGVNIAEDVVLATGVQWQ